MWTFYLNAQMKKKVKDVITRLARSLRRGRKHISTQTHCR
jgi:hypothetical protein